MPRIQTTGRADAERMKWADSEAAVGMVVVAARTARAQAGKARLGLAPGMSRLRRCRVLECRREVGLPECRRV